MGAGALGGGKVVADRVVNMAGCEGVRAHLIELLKGGSAHVDFRSAIAGFPVTLRRAKPALSPHSAWQLLEHLRITQEDILEFSRNPGHVSPKWPEGYWPSTEAPPNDGAWDESVRRFEDDLEAMKSLVTDKANDLFVPFPHGEGQTLLREALLVADHNSYHIGQLMLVRRMLEGRP